MYLNVLAWGSNSFFTICAASATSADTKHAIIFVLLVYNFRLFPKPFQLQTSRRAAACGGIRRLMNGSSPCSAIVPAARGGLLPRSTGRPCTVHVFAWSAACGNVGRWVLLRNTGPFGFGASVFYFWYLLHLNRLFAASTSRIGWIVQFQAFTVLCAVDSFRSGVNWIANVMKMCSTFHLTEWGKGHSGVYALQLFRIVLARCFSIGRCGGLRCWFGFFLLRCIPQYVSFWRHCCSNRLFFFKKRLSCWTMIVW